MTREGLASDGFKALANILWARNHAERGGWADARRSYFQAIRIQRNYVKPAGPVSTRVEHACASWLKGDHDQAIESMEGIDLGQLNWAEFPEWCREPLFLLNDR
jgi:hypothetical protein